MKGVLLALGCAALAACGSDDTPEATAPLVPQSSPAPTAAKSQLTTVPVVVPSTAVAVATSVDAPSATTSVPATTEPSTTAPASEPPAQTQPTAGTSLVYTSTGDEYAWLPVGWWDGSGWGSVDWPSSGLVIPETAFDTLSVASVELESGPLRGLTDYSPMTYGCVDDTGIESFGLPIDLPEAAEWWGYRLLAVSGDWDVQPRPVTAVGLDSPVYQELGESLVPTDDPVDPSLGDVVQVLRADLDGDGIEEVLFTFDHHADTSEGFGASGDFSLVAARYPDAAGSVVDDVLVEHVAPTPLDSPFPNRSHVMAIADLNGDGTMEVALASTYWETAAVTVYEFSGGALHQVMTSGCGV